VVDVAAIRADFSRQVNEAVAKAVAESDARHERLLAAAQKRFDSERKADIERVSQNFAVLQKYAMRDYRAAMFPDGSR
jgi:hypothetical protein